MKHYRIYLTIALLVLASLACQTLTGGADEPPSAPATDSGTEPEVIQPTPAIPGEDNSNSTVTTDFPMTPDSYNVTEVGGTLLFYTNLSLDEIMEFYRQEYTSKGYTERDLLTVISDTTFSMVFDGDPSGQAIVIQSVDLGDGSRTVTIRLEDV